jgi:hypothetical protein
MYATITARLGDESQATMDTSRLARARIAGTQR